MSRLLLLDGHSMAFRAFFALPADKFTTSGGQHTNAVHGFTSMLLNLLVNEDPTHVAVAFDLSGPTFRHETYGEYKAGRSETPPEFAGQIELIRDVLDALEIRHVDLASYEADDVIATLATQGAADGMDVLVVSGDRDAFSLVDESITVLYPVKGVSELARMDPAAVEAKYGIAPNQYGDKAALVGEKADNLPGVPGVGDKTAAKWIHEYGGLAGIVEHAHEIKGKAGESLRANLEQVLRNRQLNELVRDLDLPVTLTELTRSVPDRAKVDEVFDVLQSAALRKRVIEQLIPAGAAEEAPAPELATTVLARGQVRAWLADRPGRVALDVVGEWHRGAGEARGVALCSGAEAAYVDLTAADEQDEAALAAWLGDEEHPKALHALKGAAHMLRGRGLQLRGVVMDTELAGYLARPDQRSYLLEDLAALYLHREVRVTAAGGDQLAFDLSGDDDGGAAEAMARAQAVADLAQVLDDELAGIGATSLLTDVEIPLAHVLVAMEARGVAVDETHLRELEDQFAGAVADAEQDAHRAIDDDTVNLGSPKQLQTVLFEKLDLPKTRRTKTGYTTDAEALQNLYASTEHPFLEALLRHRDAAKLKVTVEGLRKTVADDGRIHTTYQQAIAATGRLSSMDPNLQNIPIRTDQGRRIREAFVRGPQFVGLLSADYSQIEMRIMAHLSRDAGLIEAFRTGEDLHRFVGSRVFGVDPQDVTPEMRAKVKAMSYGLAYGLSAFGLSKQLGISRGEAQELMDGYFVRFGGVRDYLRDVVKQATQDGYTATMLGRRRYLPDLTSPVQQRRETAERMALNAPIQGTAADIIKLAMLRVERRVDEEGLASRMLLQVHDELVLEVAEGEEAALEALVREEMGAAMELDVPLEVSVGIGSSWHDAH